MDGVQTQQYFVSSAQIITSIVIPTIVFCIGLVIAMLIGINKCKQWELDKIVELRRTRRLIQRITERLRETNFKTIEKAKHLRKRAVDRKKGNGQQQHKIPTNRNGNPQRRHQQQQVLWKYDETGTFTAPPSYRSSLAKASLTESPMESSPPPPYEDSLLDELYYECMKPRRIDEDDDEYD